MPVSDRSGEATTNPQASMDEWYRDANTHMEKCIEALHKDLAGIRTGRATPALVDRLMVEYYGAEAPLQSLASINAPEARLLVIAPYDRSALGAIEKALQKSDLSLNPSNDGTVIRINIPQLTEERRKEFVKLVQHRAEEARVAVRNVRRDVMTRLHKLEKDKDVSSDDIERNVARVQTLTDGFIGRVDEIARAKETDILTV